MRCKKRKFYTGEPQHIYQRTIDGFNIFYDIEDFLVFYTVFSISAKKHNVTVLQLCLMRDHVHYFIDVGHKKIMSDFICHHTSTFVREYNRSIGRSGALFEKAFGNAPKRGDKKIRTTIPYIFNNPVEKHLCQKAEDYRWNFLAYAASDTPFSKQENIMNSSKAIRRAFKEVRYCYEQGWYLNYRSMRRMFKSLSCKDKERLIDYIIVTYSPFDYDYLISFYGDYEIMLQAVNSVTGSEYDIKETYYSHSDTIYDDFAAYLKTEGHEAVRNVIMLPSEEKLCLARKLQGAVGASAIQICKFLHMRPCPPNH